MENTILKAKINNEVPEVNCEDLAKLSPEQKKQLWLIDVRRPDEYNNELGHIEGAQLLTLGPDLSNALAKGDKSKEIVFICRSGARSANATLESMSLGYKKSVNMIGGMIRWNELSYPTKKD